MSISDASKNEALANVRKKIAEVMKKNDSKITVGYRPEAVQRKEGDVWEDHDGKTWTVKNGLKQSISSLQEAKTPWFCPKCEKIMNHRFDDRFYRRRNMCYACVIAMEHQMRLDGTYEEYEQNMVRENEKSFLRDKIQELEDYIRTFSTPKVYFQDGRYEELATKDLFTKQFEILQQDIEFMKNKLETLNSIQ